VVTIIEGVAGAAVNATEEMGNSRRGVLLGISMLATKDVGLVIIESRWIIGVGDFE